MSIKTIIEDGYGSGKTARVNEEGTLNAVIHPHPPQGEQVSALPFRQYFTDNGKSTGSSDMLVNGATNNVDFYIKADQTRDIYIKTISVIIADGSAALNSFGAITALTNGVRFSWQSQEVGEIEIHEGITTNFEFIRLAAGSPAFGNAADAFRGRNISSTSEGYIPVIDCSTTFGLPFGIRLRAGTTDKLVFTVRDDVSGLDGFDIIGYGITI